MDLWKIRSQSLETINKQFSNEQVILETCFSLMQELTNKFSTYAQIDNEYTHFAAICCQILAKSYRLALGCYDLCLDTLTLEAGALGRILLEAWQLLIYLRKDPTRVELIFQGKLPPAGKIAKDIQEELHDQLKGLRDYYNQHNSHLSFEKNALVSLNMNFDGQALYENMRSLFLLMISLIIDASYCLLLIHSSTDELFHTIEVCHHEGLLIFTEDEKKACKDS